MSNVGSGFVSFGLEVTVRKLSASLSSIISKNDCESNVGSVCKLTLNSPAVSGSAKLLSAIE